jgi:hypothetical protein
MALGAEKCWAKRSPLFFYPTFFCPNRPCFQNVVLMVQIESSIDFEIRSAFWSINNLSFDAPFAGTHVSVKGAHSPLVADR